MKFDRLAARDLNEIWSYGWRKWGEAQADRYAADLRTTLRRLQDFPLSGTEIPERPGRYWIESGAHRIVYRVSAREITIVRVLHGRMDVASQLR